MLKKMKSPTHCHHMLLPPNKKWTTTSEIVIGGLPMLYPSVPPVPINVPLLTGACSIFNSFAFIVSIVLSLYRLCTLSCTFFHARLMREFNSMSMSIKGRLHMTIGM